MCYAWKNSDRCLGLFAESYKTSEYSAWLGISPIGHSWGFICSAFSTIFSIIFSTIFCLTWHLPYCWPFLEIYRPGLLNPSCSQSFPIFQAIRWIKSKINSKTSEKEVFFHICIYRMFFNLFWWTMMINQILENFMKEEHWSSVSNFPFWYWKLRGTVNDNL